MKKIFLFAFAALALGFTACVEDEPYVGPPAINDVTFTPEFPTPDDNVTVTAKVTDNSGVESVTLKYKVNDGAEQSVDMTGTGSTYTGVIPKQDNNAKVTFHITAKNTAGLTTNSPERSFTVGAEPVLLFINECDPNAKKWELYNGGETEIDLSGWTMIKDNETSSPFTFPEGTKISAGAFMVLTQNAAGSPTFGMSPTKGFKYDIFDKDGALIETFDNLGDNQFNNNIGATESVGRKPDGSATIVTFTQVTMGSSNNNATVKQ